MSRRSAKDTRAERGLAAMFDFEHLGQPLATPSVFLTRLAVNVGIVLGMVAVSLVLGMAGYHVFEGMSWLDAFLNAAMILSGMGPVADLQSSGGKLFAGFYALYSGLFLIIAAGIVLGPFLHRVMHKLHVPDDGSTDDK